MMKCNLMLDVNTGKTTVKNKYGKVLHSYTAYCLLSLKKIFVETKPNVTV